MINVDAVRKGTLMSTCQEYEYRRVIGAWEHCKLHLLDPHQSDTMQKETITGKYKGIYVLLNV